MPGPCAAEVLLLEDEQAIADAIVEILSVEGYVVRIAATVEQARAEIARQRPDVVLLDYMLAAGATSEPLLVELLAEPRRPALLLYSATSAALPVAKRYGVRFLAKPFDLDVLVATVRELLDATPPHG